MPERSLGLYILHRSTLGTDSASEAGLRILPKYLPRVVTIAPSLSSSSRAIAKRLFYRLCLRPHQNCPIMRLATILALLYYFRTPWKALAGAEAAKMPEKHRMETISSEAEVCMGDPTISFRRGKCLL